MRRILLLVFGTCIMVLLTTGTLYADTITSPPTGSLSVTAEGGGRIGTVLDVPLNMEEQLFSWLNTISGALGLEVSDNKDLHAIAISDSENS